MLNVSADYNDTVTSNSTNDYKKITNNCTNIENNIDLNIPTLLATIPYGLSFICLISLIIYTLIKPLINNK